MDFGKATKEFLNHRGTPKAEFFGCAFSPHLLPRDFPHSSPLFPLQARQSPLLPLSLISLPGHLMTLVRELSFPLQRAQEASGVEILQNWGKITKKSPPQPDPRQRGTLPQKGGKNYSENAMFDVCDFGENFPQFRGSDWRGI